MTPMKCYAHELRPGELADSPRYVAALRAAPTCWRCRLLAVMARVFWRLTTPPERR